MVEQPGPAGESEAARVQAAAVERSLRLRIRHLERELGRVRSSRKVLMELLWRLDRDWTRRLAVLEDQNRRLWSARDRRAGTDGG